MDNFDVIVVGGGHAGVEASFISSKLGCKTLLLTHLIDNIALASCNPAIGGLGKGHLVKEIDSLGGLMGVLTDMSGLQYRILNASKGPAVRGSRAQIDMDIYKIHARNILLKTKNLYIKQANAIQILTKNKETIGVQTDISKKYFAKKIIITAGTFLRGLIHIGKNKSENGRAGEVASNDLSNSLLQLGIPLQRLKTGTCPRVLGDSINFKNLEKHYGDSHFSASAPYFSLFTHYLLNGGTEIPFKALKDRIQNNVFSPSELPCYVTYTNSKTHEIVSNNFDRAPLFTGQIEGVGPRYCPSIEDKVNRFKEKTRHQLFLEPQTFGENEYYVNGLSTSLPYDVQENIIKSIEGLENAHITRFGYAIEYDYSPPTNLFHTLESKIIKNLFLAGQINGTTGYEEAAAQGLMAGINAVMSIKNEDKFILDRKEGYIGVMIDDLVSKGTNEPYRMFTSRSEFRLLLREDNACFRMLKYQEKWKLLPQEIIDLIKKDFEDIKNFSYMNEFFTPNKENLKLLESINESPINNKVKLSLILGRDSMNPEKIRILLPSCSDLSDRALHQIQIESKYESYIKKQEIQISKINSTLSLKIPDNFEYNVSGLSLEVIEKLNMHRPKTLQEASLISGITPASIEVLELHLRYKKTIN